MKQIEWLAMGRTFAELDAREQEQVLAQMTASDFDHLHQVLKHARALDAHVAPPPALGLRLQQRMAKGISPVPKPSILARIVTFRVPAWQAAAAVIVLLMASRFSGTSENGLNAFPAPVSAVIQTDTVFLETIRWKERIVVRTPTTPFPALADIPTEKRSDPVSTENTAPETFLEMSTTGSPIGEQPELVQFFTGPASK